MEKLKKRLVELDAIHGVSGDEGKVADYLVSEMKPFVDEFYSDNLGNQVFMKRGASPDYKIMLSAHMDEIGYVVRFIDESGFIYIYPVGIHDPRMAINQYLTINTSKGIVTGVTGVRPSHIVSQEEAGRTVPLEEIFIDVGTSSRQETLELGVNIGDYVSFHCKGQFLNNGHVFAGKSVDNRAGCVVLLEVMESLQDLDIFPTVYAVATVQEEIGIRGAGPATFAIEPQLAIAIDVAFAGGTPNTPEKSLPINMGGGPAIKFFDWSLKTFNGNAVPKKLTQQIIIVAEANGIPYQRDVVLHGATDGAKISLAGKGVLTGGVSIPMRYMHTAVGTVCIEDIKNSATLIKEIILRSQEFFK